MKPILSIVAAAAVGILIAALLANRGNASNTNKVDSMNSQTSKTVKVRLLDDKGVLSAPIETPKVVKTDAEWQKQLTSAQYKVARAKGTEAAFCGTLLDNKKPGIYYCVCCDLPLFTSESKFHSGTGWPSFFQPIAEENVAKHSDHSYGMDRTEILCARCDCHLGHVFDDGPNPTGLRFCLNSASLTFKEDKHYKESSE